MSQRVNSIWFGKIGIVLVFDSITKIHKAYIGTGLGVNREGDEKFIAEWGTPFPLDATEKLFGITFSDKGRK